MPAPACSVRLDGPRCVCKGASGTYGAVKNPDGGSLSWSVSRGATLTSRSSDQAVVRAEDAGTTATLHVVYRVGDCTATASATIVMPKLSGIDGPDCTCIGKPLTFKAKTDAPACDVFAWSGGENPATGSGSTFVTTFSTHGKKTITCKCGDQVVTLEVTVCEIVDGDADPTTVFPNDPVDFSVVLEPGCAKKDVEWSGGGAPATGTGASFTTKWPAGGTYTVTAKCGTSSKTFTIKVCDIAGMLATAGAYYGPSLDLSDVTIKESSVMVGGRAWTANDTVRFPRNACPSQHDMIHELAHVWEHQNGEMQILGGLVEQIGNSLVPGYNPYDYGGPAGVSKASSLDEFSLESKAQIIEEYWKSQNGIPNDRNGTPFTPAYIADLQKLVTGAGIGTNPPGGSTSTVGGIVDTGVTKALNGVLGLFGQ